MSLPAIDIPLPPLPIEIPLMLHSPVVHFAVALPVVLLLIEVINLIMKRRALNVTSTILIILIGLIFFAAFLTGKTDGKEAFALLSLEGQEELKEHKLLGIYLVYATGVLLLFKIVSLFVKKVWSKILYLVLLIAFIGLTFLQGKHGGELVFKYGANVKAVSELEDKIEALEEEIDNLKNSSSAKESVKEESSSENVQKEANKEEKVQEESLKVEETAKKESETKETPAKDMQKNIKEEEIQEDKEAIKSVKDEEKSKEENVQEKVKKENQVPKEEEKNIQQQHPDISSMMENIKEKANEVKESVEEKAKEVEVPSSQNNESQNSLEENKAGSKQ